MYTIRQASVRSGVAVARIRAWERRYGIAAPGRSAGGYRLYDDAAVTRLRAMRQLIDGGWTASLAAEAVLDVPDAPPGGSAGLDALPGSVAYPTNAAAEAEAFVAAAAAFDVTGIEASLDGFFSRGSYERVIDDLVLPAVAALGAAWAAGRLDIAAEHLASASVQRRLASLFDLGGTPGSGPAIVLGLPPGSHHEIGALAFGVAVRRQGVDVLYLGPDVPVASWVHVARERVPKLAVIGVTRQDDEGPAREVASAMNLAMPRVEVAMGGAAAARAATGTAGGIVRVLPPRVTDAATEVATVLHSR